MASFSRNPIVIIGGGLAGMTAAAHLVARGLPVIVLEANQSWLGGRLAGGEPETFAHGGETWAFPWEHGIHGLWGGYVNMRATLNRFIPDEDLRPTPSGGEVWIHRWGESIRRVEAGTAVRSWVLPAPFHYLNLLLRPRFWGAITPLDFLSAPGLIFSVLWAIGSDPLREKAALDGFTMDDFFRLWTPNLRATIEGVARNMLAAPDEAITFTGLVAALRFYTLLRRDDWHPHFFPANSRVCVFDPLEAHITAGGGQVLRGMTAHQLARTDDDWQVTAEDAWGGFVTLDGSAVILAANAGGTRSILLNSADTQAAAGAMRFPGSLRNTVVRLWFDAPPKDPAPSGMFTGDFVPDNYFWLHRIHREYADWAAAGGSAIEMHFYGDAALLNQPDRNFLVIALEEAQRAFPELKGRYIHGAVRRNSAVHTAFRVMTDDMLHVETPWPGVYACGDWVGGDTPSLWMERACTTGIMAANHILAAHSLEPYPVLQPKKPEPAVRVLAVGVGGIRAAFRPLVMALRRRRQRRKASL